MVSGRKVLSNSHYNNCSLQYTQSFPHQQQRQLSSSSGGGGDQVQVSIDNHPDGPDYRDVNRVFAQVSEELN